MQAVRDKRTAAEQGLRDEIERLHKELEERLARKVKVMHEQEEIELEGLIVEREKRIVLRRIYHEAPNDIMELIMKLFTDLRSDGLGEIEGKGGMNVLRLVSKRLLRVVESCATRLTQVGYNGSDSFPLVLRRCKRTEHITCKSSYLRSLEGCPDGLKTLEVYGWSLESLEPLRGCAELESLTIANAHRIIDLSPLSSCPRLKKLSLLYSPAADLSPLSSLALLEDLSIMGCRNVKNLEPLSGPMNVQRLHCRGIDPQTSLMPLASCTGLKELWCNKNAVDHQELERRLPGLKLLQY